VRRFTKAALGGLAGCALVLGGTQAASGGILLQQAFPGWLADLETDNVGPLPLELPLTGAFDSAKAKLMVIEHSNGKTTFSLKVEKIDGYAGREFGSHLHTGPCLPDSPSSAGPHYTNPDLDPLVTTLEEREVWFKLVPNEDGVAADETVVPYVPKDPDGNGIMSIVIHRDPTNTAGGAGPREVCLPLETTWGTPQII
jgi:Cu/Zn superoxide dismutase